MRALVDKSSDIQCRAEQNSPQGLLHMQLSLMLSAQNSNSVPPAKSCSAATVPSVLHEGAWSSLEMGRAFHICFLEMQIWTTVTHSHLPELARPLTALGAMQGSRDSTGEPIQKATQPALPHFSTQPTTVLQSTFMSPRYEYEMPTSKHILHQWRGSPLPYAFPSLLLSSTFWYFCSTSLSTPCANI